MEAIYYCLNLWKTYGKLNMQGIYKTLAQNICNKCFKLSSFFTNIQFVNHPPLCQQILTLSTTLHFVNPDPLCQPLSALSTTLHLVNKS